ncbi:G-alpha-domain-containing protein [Gloeophyllum trabeum ATCC 11539]|uniref:G-alpha-domain-containing protein n=1 Tax=Gloeophyllum trabeum (strain ATCC 11539 / FP-39264 / Madison 617) TaxID=670483 RepID=S7RS63_GLOTA|nr:G-alpha-domain-containing protein [Gloeophyllum trabeum ATCC 11539]EPQ55869.1 G-alpha-domain-containing protein [Gloeophyllum trabeum ATCC 11539]
MGRSIDVDDPLSLAIAPPANETHEERIAREKREAEARRVSDEIDEMLRQERAAMKKRRPVKVLLLGQSESGKSTTLKNFQLTYARKAWAEDRSSWKAVVQFNLVRNINTLLDIMSREMGTRAPRSDSPDSDLDYDEADDAAAGSADTDMNPSTAPAPFTEHHHVLKLRLGPLRRIQEELEARLGSGASELVQTSSSTSAGPFDSPRRPQEFYVRSNNWKTALKNFRPFGRAEGRRSKDFDTGEDVTEVLATCREDMKALWEDPVLQDVLRKNKIRMEESSGFFLNDIDRIATRDYEPSDDDVVRARLRTLGVQEYRFVFEIGRTAGHEWLMYDVGGARTSRAAWVPYFDDVDAVIFLAPISAFDEKLAEDKRVNRLEDSYLLWKAICGCKPLAKTQIILFLNKIDLLEKKLASGVKVKDYVPSFGDRSNDVATATKYFQQHFREIAKQSNPEPRPFFVHLTTATDTKSTAATLSVVEEGILRDHLRRADLL